MTKAGKKILCFFVNGRYLLGSIEEDTQVPLHNKGELAFAELEGGWQRLAFL
jgi:hypothetical protein